MLFNGEFRKKYRQGVDLIAGVEGTNNIDFAHQTRIKNMNLEGMNIETSLSLAIGEKRNIRFFIGNGESLKMQCRIIWNKPDGNSHQYGVIFSDVNLWNKFKLRRFIARKKKLEMLSGKRTNS